jgi:N,N'-diacetyllegionaminate synthase
MPLPSDRPYLIGETAFHHQGSEADLMAIVDAVAEAGCHAVKFHLLADLDDYMVQAHPAYDTVAPWLFDEAAWDRIIAHAVEHHLEIVLLCNDPGAVEMVIRKGWPTRACEVHATGINDALLLRAISNVPGTVILGVGGCSLGEIQHALSMLKAGGKDDVLLMHGFQNYPTIPDDVRLSRMEKLRDLFDLPVGYADHTAPDHPEHVAISASVAVMGINVLEKHITPWPGEQRIDHQAAIDVSTMRRTSELMSTLWSLRGRDPLVFSPAEQRYGLTGPMKKAIVARRDLSAGTILSLDDLAYKRTGREEILRQDQLLGLVGARVLRDLKKDSPLVPDAVEWAEVKAEVTQFFIRKQP